MALRVFALVTDAYGAGGGIAQYNRDFFSALEACAHVDEIVVLARTGRLATTEAPSKVKPLAIRHGRVAFSLQAIQAIRQAEPFDLIFCGHLFMAPLAALLSKISGVPIWLQLHGIEAWKAPGRFQQWAALQSTLVTAVSRYTRRRFLSWSTTPPENVKVLPNTVEARFTPGAKSRNILDRYALNGKKVLLTVSRLASTERYKGHDRVIEALADLHEDCPDIVYVVAGDGDDRPRLERIATASGVSDRVRFIGYVTDAELPDLYRAADVFVMPSSGEGFGIVFLQALASGVRTIGGNGDGSRDPLRDGQDGRLVPTDDTAAIAFAIRASISDAKAPFATDFRNAFDRSNFLALVAELMARFSTSEFARVNTETPTVSTSGT